VYGVPENLDLSHFIGKTLTPIPLGEFQIQFCFHPTGTISVEGDWELVDSQGALVDRAMENAARSEYRVHRLLGQDVISFEIDAPRSLSLKFTSGLVLRIFDNSPAYESFSIQPGDIYV
jgi:hypothetical protein